MAGADRNHAAGAVRDVRHDRRAGRVLVRWIGIGGGYVDAGCTVGDNTLIQTGTEQDVSSAGQVSYSAWREIVPGPSVSISMTVQPRDHMHAAIAEAVPAPDQDGDGFDACAAACAAPTAS